MKNMQNISVLLQVYNRNQTFYRYQTKIKQDYYCKDPTVLKEEI